MTPSPSWYAGWQHHQQGQLDQAEAIYRRVLAAQPNHPEALHLLGLVALQRGEAARAADLISQAIAVNSCAASYHCNLAEARRRLGQLPEALASCHAALALRPHYPEALHNLGVILFQQRRYREAEQAYREALLQRPDSPRTLTALADALRERGRIADALAQYQRAIELAPNLPAAHANYGLLLVQRGELEKGLEHCRLAVQLQPADPLILGNLGRLLLEYGHIDEAMQHLGEAIQRAPDSASLCLSMGRAWAELADYAEAGRWFQRALALDPELHVARCRLAMLLLECGDPEQAARICRDVLQQEPACVEAHVALARALLEQGEVDAAVASQKEAIRLRPEGAGLHAGLGDILSSGGDLDAAVAAHRQAIALNPRCVPARAGLATILRGKTNDDDLMQIEQLLQAPWMTDKQRAALHFALAQARDGRGDYARAAEHMLTANALMRQHYREREQDYNPAEYQQYIDRLIAAFTPAYFERVRGWGRDSERPVFIVGMPRSGTTLAEQILASHPRVHGAGERRFAFLGFNALPAAVGRDAPPAECLDGLTPAIVQRLADWHLQQLHGLDQGRSSRVVDKMPDNFSLLGWIVTLFPRARIIHCQRDVRDVALSCWITNFARIRWANDLEHLASRINEYRRIIAHYHRVLPVPIFPLDYEQMVADQEATTRRLLDFVGLDWDPACLHFHQTERLVRTASVAQVRQPIYQRSVARWKRYETMLRPLLDRLQLSQESGAGEPGGER